MEKSIKELKEERQKLKKVNKKLMQELHEVKKSIDAIKTGNIDALVIANEKHLKVFIEKSADRIYRVLIEKMHEGAVTLNEDGIILYCNSYFSGMVNLPLQKVMGSEFKNFIDDSSKERFETLFKKVRQNVIKEEFSLYTTNGKVTPVLISANTLQIDDILVWSIIITDLTIAKKNQEELKTQKELLEEAETIAEIGSWVVDLSTNKVTSSRELYKIYGLEPAKDFGNLSPFELIHQKDIALSKIIFDTAVNKTGAFDTYARINTPHDNREKILHVKGKVITKNEEAFQLIGISQDVTALIKAQQGLEDHIKQLIEAQEKITKFNEELGSIVKERTKELQLAYDRLYELNDELKEVNNSKDKFISIISHDLRNPVAAIVSSSEIMMKEIETLQKDDIKNFTRIINASSNKIVDQLNELVEWSTQKTKKINFNPQIKNLYDFVLFSLELIQNNADQKNITISLNIEKNIHVKVDPLLLRSIIQNLITNSIKFTPEGGEITVSASKKSKSFIEISIADTGIGMPEEVRSKIFSDESVMTKPGAGRDKASGLGLILVKDFVEKHKGKVWVESESGKGTTFYFTLPIADL